MPEAAPENLHLAAEDVEHAFRLLEFSIRVLDYIELGKVDLELFGQDTTIRLEKENVTYSDGHFSTAKNAVLTAQIAVGVSFAASAIALDNFFEAAGHERDPASADEFNSLWALVYAVRNAFAHGIANPTWAVKGKYQRRVEMTLAGTKTAIDLAVLDGRPFEYTQIGGFTNWPHIKDRALTMILP